MVASLEEEKLLCECNTPPSTQPSPSCEIKETSLGLDLSRELPPNGTPTPITSNIADHDSCYSQGGSLESSNEARPHAVLPIETLLALRSNSHSHIAILDITTFPRSPPLTPPRARSKTAESPFSIGCHVSSGSDANHGLNTPPSTPLRGSSQASGKSTRDVFGRNQHSKNFLPAPKLSVVKFFRKHKELMPFLASYAPAETPRCIVKTTFLIPRHDSALRKHAIPPPTPPTAKKRKPAPNHTAWRCPRKPVKRAVEKSGLLTLSTTSAMKITEARRQASPCPTTCTGPIALATPRQTPPTSSSKAATSRSPTEPYPDILGARVEAAPRLTPETAAATAATLCDSKYSQQGFPLTRYAPNPAIDEEVEAGIKAGWGRKPREPTPLELSRAKRRVMLRKLSYGMGEEVRAVARRPCATKQDLELERERARGYGLGLWETEEADAETLIALQLEHMKLYFAGPGLC
ncbi:hypothetical protein B2J93_1142 [Marssonina coronariae]|uniref:Uncharacterized protein n=1 Tax=Diplocarpon coronariae TaxID=2795749 RepID=A0A218YVS3_9HELO|nr:hypothetical protein JHW43_001615 [Diplocarpon mali]OWO99254.1 hypothetical protein B2J93_1142 [Marssonina coronariae]